MKIPQKTKTIFCFLSLVLAILAILNAPGLVFTLLVGKHITLTIAIISLQIFGLVFSLVNKGNDTAGGMIMVALGLMLLVAIAGLFLIYDNDLECNPFYNHYVLRHTIMDTILFASVGWLFAVPSAMMGDEIMEKIKKKKRGW